MKRDMVVNTHTCNTMSQPPAWFVKAMVPVHDDIKRLAGDMEQLGSELAGTLEQLGSEIRDFTAVLKERYARERYEKRYGCASDSYFTNCM